MGRKKTCVASEAMCRHHPVEKDEAPPSPVRASIASPSRTILTLARDLLSLRNMGFLTSDEFSERKNKLLDQHLSRQTDPDAGSRWSRILAPVTSTVGELLHGVARSLSIDARTAALFRIAMAGTVVSDVLANWPDRCDFFSDEGLLVRNTIHGTMSVLLPNVHTMDGSCDWTTKIFHMQLCLAISMLLGFCPSICSGLLWFLYLSQSMRNPFAMSGGDSLLRISCMWGAFMPLGSCMSLDNVLWPTWSDCVYEPKASEGIAIFDWGTLGQRLQVSAVYFTTALFKHRARTPRHPVDVSPWVRGVALRHALACCDYLTWWGELLARQRKLCCFLTWSTLLIEYGAPILLWLLNGKERMLLILMLQGMHVVMGLVMNLENFSMVCIAALTCFVPSEFWEWAGTCIHGGEWSSTVVCCRGSWRYLLLRCVAEFSLVPTTITRCERAFEEHGDAFVVVVDEQRRVLFSGMQAYGHVFRMCPFLWPIGQLVRKTRVRGAGELRTRSMSPTCFAGATGISTRLIFRQRSIPIALIGAAAVWMLIAISMENVWHTLEDERRPTDNATRMFDAQRDLSEKLGLGLGLSVRWDMFASPPRQCGWYRLPAKMRQDGPYNGSWVDAHKLRHYPGSDASLTWGRPEYPAHQHDSPLWHAWYELLFSAARVDEEEMNFKLESTARFYCRTYPEIESLQIVHTIERYNFTTYATTVRNETLWAKVCENHTEHTGARPNRSELLADPTERYSSRKI